VKHRFCWIGTLVLAILLGACGDAVVAPNDSTTEPEAVALVPGVQAEATTSDLPVHDLDYPGLPDSVYWDSSNAIEFTDSNGQWRVQRVASSGGQWSHATIDLDGVRKGTLRPTYSGGVITEVRFEPASTSGEWMDIEESTGSILDASEPLPDDECDPLLDEGSDCCTQENQLGDPLDDGGGCEAELNYVELNSLSIDSMEDGPDDDPCWDEFERTTTELGSAYILFKVSGAFFAAPEPTGVTKGIGIATFAGGVVQGARGLISAGFYFACHLLN